MAVRTTVNISLTPELEQFIQSRVQTGRYQSVSEVVREGLRLLEEREQERELAFAALKKKLQRAAAQADRGQFVTAEQVLREIDRLKQERAMRKA